jgi:hypothetical protein
MLKVVYFFFVAFSAALVVLPPLPSPRKSQQKTSGTEGGTHSSQPT